MFDPIKGPPNEFAGPSVGHSTENGDSWFTAIRKINAGFKSIVDRLESGVSEIVGKADKDARDRVSEVEDRIHAVDERIACLEEKLAQIEEMLLGHLTVKVTDPAPPPEPVLVPNPTPLPDVQPAAAPVVANPEFGSGISK